MRERSVRAHSVSRPPAARSPEPIQSTMAVPAFVAVVVPAVGVLLALAAASAAAPGPRARAVAVVDGCGAADRWCLAFPDGCAGSAGNGSAQDCSTVLTVRRDPAPGSDKYLFDMAASYSGYVAVALAETTSMGVDSTVQCVFDAAGKQVVVYQSVNLDRNPATGKRGNARLPAEAQKGVKLVAGKLEDGVISCSFLRDPVTVANGSRYDLATGSWVLQAAAGDRLGDDSSIKHHVEWVVSPEKVKLSEPSGLILGSYGLRRPPKAGTGTAGPPAALGAVTLLMALATHCVRLLLAHPL